MVREALRKRIGLIDFWNVELVVRPFGVLKLSLVLLTFRSAQTVDNKRQMAMPLVRHATQPGRRLSLEAPASSYTDHARLANERLTTLAPGYRFQYHTPPKSEPVSKTFVSRPSLRMRYSVAMPENPAPTTRTSQFTTAPMLGLAVDIVEEKRVREV